MTASTHSNFRRDFLLKILSLLILLSLIERCQAQGNGPGAGFVALPVSLFVVTATIMCACFWIISCSCFFYQRAQQRHNNLATTRYTPYNPQRPSPYGGVTQPYPVQGYVEPSTTPDIPPLTQAYPGQAYVPPSTVAVPNIPSASGATSHTIPQASEPVSLPDATLHQGDAPPGYAEAIGMKTVDIAGQDKDQA